MKPANRNQRLALPAIVPGMTAEQFESELDQLLADHKRRVLEALEAFKRGALPDR